MRAASASIAVRRSVAASVMAARASLSALPGRRGGHRDRARPGPAGTGPGPTSCPAARSRSFAARRGVLAASSRATPSSAMPRQFIHGPQTLPCRPRCGPIDSVRWRAASNNTRAPAMATLSDSTRPAIGMWTQASMRSAAGDGQPVGLVAEDDGDGRRSGRRRARACPRRPTSRPGGGRPHATRSRATAASDSTTTGTRKTEPAEARTVLGENGSTESPANTTAPAPAASAVRSSVPALPGSATSTSTTIVPASMASSSASVDGSSGATARMPWGVTAAPTRASAPSATS